MPMADLQGHGDMLEIEALLQIGGITVGFFIKC